jgi:4-aminobutyrate aminotransferase-like enzyme
VCLGLWGRTRGDKVHANSRTLKFKFFLDCPQIRGLGLIMAVEFVADRETKEAFPAAWGKRLAQIVLEFLPFHSTEPTDASVYCG